MLPLKLEIENINSFTTRQTVDFSAVAGDGLFCICGDTGAGKTTILDSVIIALYGMGTSGKEVGGDRGGKDDYINVGADKAAVSFTFRLDGKTYCIERSFTRSGVHTALLYSDGELICRGASAVNEAVETLIGLKKEQFTQVIILEQGKFSKFLNAGKAARIRTVMKLFRLERFDLASKVNKYYGDLKNKLDVLAARLEQYKDDTDAHMKAMKAECRALEKTTAGLNARLDAGRKALAAETEKENAFNAYDAAKARADELGKALADATAALDAVERSDGAQLETLAAQAADRAAEAKNRLEKIRNAQPGLAEYAKVSENLDKARDDYKKLQADKAGADAQVKAETDENARIKAELAAVMSDIAPLAAALLKADGLSPAGLRTAAQVRLSEIRKATADYTAAAAQRQKIEQEAARLNAQWDECARGYAARKQAADEAAAAYERARRQCAKAELTAGLKPGDACPLCGGVLKDIPSADGLYGYKAAAEKAANELKKADELNVALNEQLRATSERLQELNGLQPPDAAVADCERLAEAADRAAGLSDKLAESDKRLTAALAAADKLADRLTACLNEGKSTADRLDSLKRAVERELGAIVCGEAFDAWKTTAEREAAEADKRAAELAQKARAHDGELKRLTAEKAAADGAYRQAAEAVKPAPPADRAVRTGLEREIDELEKQRADAAGRYGALTEKVRTMRDRIALKRELEESKKELAGRLDTAGLLVRALRKNSGGDDLTAFVAEEYIREFTADASERLNRLTGGKYTLEYADGEFSVRDFMNGNRSRRAQTLSGGETFLASLSLAVAISDILAADRSYGFFFLDEGFGTLDEGLIGSVSEALKSLSRDTLVGVVTHSPELIELIPAKIRVTAASGESGSVIA